MTITAYPFENQDTTEIQYSLLFRELADSGIADTIGGTGFAVRASGTGMTVLVAPGMAIVRGHAVISSADEPLPIAAAGGAPRADRVVLRLDPVQNTIALAVVQGEPGSGPPGLIQTDTGIYEIALAQIRVDAGALSIMVEKIIDERPYIGSRVGAWTTGTRPPKPRTGRLGLNTSTRQWEFWDGSAWSDLAPVTAWTSITGKPAAFTPLGHRHGWNDLDNVPSSFTPAAHTHTWDGVTGKPSAFPAAAHGHSGEDITTGTVPFSRLPVGGGGTQVAAGNHAHAYAATNHGHASVQTSTRSLGTDGAHAREASGAGPYYSVWVDGAHNFCRNTSSIRFKTNVRDHDIEPADVLALQPRLFDRKDTTRDDGTVSEGHRDEYGLIAEEVHQHVPELVIRDEEDRIDGLRYDLLAVALLSVAKDQQVRITALEDQLAGLQTAVKVLAGGE